MLKISNPTCEYQPCLLGIDITKPRFSWMSESDKRNTIQASYQIMVAEDNQFKKIVWDSGELSSDQSTHIKYNGESLKSFTRYFYKVRISDQFGRYSEWSMTNWFETAFLEGDDWKAKWITPKKQGVEEEVFALRNTLTLKDDILSARVYVTSLGIYQLYINGTEIGDALLTPGWTSYHHRLQYQTYDVTNNLAKGSNALGILLSEGWFKGMGFDKPYKYGENLSALLELHVVYQDGKKEIFTSNEEWKSGESAFVAASIYNGETYDARLENNWSEPDFRDESWEPVDCSFKPDAKLVAQQNELVRVTETITPIEYIVTPKGEKVLDMGQNMVGRMRMRVTSPKGTKITLKHAEVLDKDGNFYTENLRTAKQEVIYITKGDGEETYAPTFTFQGFRYVKVEGYPSKDLSLDDFTGEVIHSDMERTGEFITDNELINRLHSNVVWGQRGNFVDVPTDCPQRNERLGWTGDAQVFIGTALYNYQGASFFKKWLLDLKADQKPDGQVPFVIPDIIPGNQVASGWNDAATIIPWTLYQVYGDKQILEDQYESMKAWVEKVRSLATNETVWKAKIQFGDWLALDGDPHSPVGATPIPLIATAYHAYSTHILAKAASVLGFEKDADEYIALYEKIVADFQAEFTTATGNVIGGTQTSYIIPLAFNLLKGDAARKAAHELHRMIVANDYHLTTGFLGTPHLCSVLSKYGYHETALRLLLQDEYPSWLFEVKNGATTIWERWNSMNPDGTFNDSGMTSFNHYAYGAVAEWMHNTIAGISFDETTPGYKKFTIAPKISPLGMTEVKASYKSLYGEVVSEWKLNENEITLKVTVPVNTEADVILPAHASNITLDGDGKQQSTFTLGSGNYFFMFQLDQVTQKVFTNESVLGEVIYYPEAKAIVESYLTNFMHGEMPPHVAFQLMKGMTFGECKVTPETGITSNQVDEILEKINKIVNGTSINEKHHAKI
ncbi:alpha-L-rhamnosidase [Metabacillus halosaccharovorans]|uniref:alpha-L-rhamnosidase n=1 Tax=Metabacillus halosaccharovorans TaxID=930124 RepID=UPI001C1FAAD9|nr:alpha-L-rhamnosidase [Metabacillus halosaccharovorans]MBU7592721.1 Bacterial alpha-L-rhamnosidase [Metabacillus halosaccharovorans]